MPQVRVINGFTKHVWKFSIPTHTPTLLHASTACHSQQVSSPATVAAMYVLSKAGVISLQLNVMLQCQAMPGNKCPWAYKIQSNNNRFEMERRNVQPERAQHAKYGPEGWKECVVCVGLAPWVAGLTYPFFAAFFAACQDGEDLLEAVWLNRDLQSVKDILRRSPKCIRYKSNYEQIYYRARFDFDVACEHGNTITIR